MSTRQTTLDSLVRPAVFVAGSRRSTRETRLSLRASDPNNVANVSGKRRMNDPPEPRPKRKPVSIIFFYSCVLTDLTILRPTEL
jgi:hypothetical protein